MVTASFVGVASSSSISSSSTKWTGISNSKVILLWSSEYDALTVPWRCSTSSLTKDSPIPVPSLVWLAWKNLSNSLLVSSSKMLSMSLDTFIISWLVSVTTALKSIVPPSEVYLMAFPNRLPTIFSIISGSNKVTGIGPKLWEKIRLRFLARYSKGSNRDRIKPPKWIFSGFSFREPVSNLFSSIIWLTKSKSLLVLFSTNIRSFFKSGLGLFSNCFLIGPLIRVKGVLNSWEILEYNFALKSFNSLNLMVSWRSNFNCSFIFHLHLKYW